MIQEIESKAYKKFKKGKSINDFILKQYCNMFKYTLECNSILPPICLKMPQMIVNTKSKTQNGQNGSGIKLKPTTLFDDQKKQDLFDFEEEISDQN